MLLEAAIFFALFVALLVVRRLSERKNITEFTFPIKLDASTWKNFSHGAVAGLIYAAAYCLLIVISGNGSLIVNGFETAKQTLSSASAIVLLVVAESLFAESFFRGLVLEKFLTKFDMGAAVASTSALYCAIMAILFRENPYLIMILVNSFLLSVILCLMTISSKSLVPGLGKEMAFGLAQGLLFSYLPHVETPAVVNLSVSQSPFSGTPGVIASSMAFTIVLAVGLAYEIHHFRAHHH